MLKKIVSFLVAVSMMCASVFAAQNGMAEKYTNAVKLLEKLGIMYEKNEAEYGSGVSRADFAVYVARTMGIDDNVADTETRYFVDMASYDYATYSVNSLVERGVLSVGENRMFRPSDAVTYEEAVKIAVCMTGYGQVAASRGGFPTGYVKTASQLDIVSGKAGDVFSLNDAALLLWRTLVTPQYVIGSVTTEGDDFLFGYYEAEKNTLLYDYFGFNYVEGILTGFDGTNIAFDVCASDGMAVVDGRGYTVKENYDISEFIGRNIGVLYDDNDVIDYVFPEKVSERIIEIDAKDLISYDGKEIVYAYGERGEKEVDVSTAVVLYNGSTPEAGISSLINNIESGTIRLINSDGKGEYEAVVVTDYKAFVFKSADKVNNVLYSRINGQSGIELDKYDKVDMVDVNGNTVTVDMLEQDFVLNVASAADYSRIKIIVNDSKVNGLVSKIKTSGVKEITVEQRVYPVNKKHESVLSDIATGKKVTLLLNMFGEVVMLSDVVYENMKVGYLTGISLDNTAFADSLMFRIYTKDAGIVTYNASKGLRIDGIKYNTIKQTAESIPDTVFMGDSVSSKSQIIQYKLTADNEISYIDTHNVSSREDEKKTLARVHNGTVMKYNGRFNKNFPVNSSTDIYCAPAEENLSSNSNDYFVAKQDRFNNAVSFNMELYKLKGENEFIDAVIYHVNPVDTEANDWANSYVFMVNEIYEEVDKNAEKYKIVTGLQQGADKQLEIYEEKLTNGSALVSDLSEGDLIRYRTNQSGKVISIQKLYDEKTGETIGWSDVNEESSLFVSDFNNNFELSMGYVNKVGDKVVSWGYKSGADVDEAVDLSTMKFMIYDRNQRDGNRIYTGTMDAIVDYESALDKCDVIILQMRQTTLMSAVIYKR